MARALLQKGEMAEAIRMLETQGVWSAGYLGFAYGVRGERRRAEALAVENASCPARTVLIYAGLGDRVRAYHALEAMAKAGDPRVGMYYNSPELRLLHRDSDTAAVLKRLGLPAGV